MEIPAMIASPNSLGTNTERTISFLRAYKRVIAFLLIFGFCAYPLIDRGKFLAIRVAVRVILVMLIASQIFWVRRALDLGERFIPRRPRRAWLPVIAGAVYLSFFAYSSTHRGVANFFVPAGVHIIGAADRRVPSILIDGVLSWWLVGSVLGFALVMVFWTVDRVMRASAWVFSRARAAAAAYAAAPTPAPLADFSPARRRFLGQTVIALSATPFVASAYGLLYGRLDVEVTRRRISLARLPKAFEGFRIAQLSDFHIGPFMCADQIRHCVAITNNLKPDLVVMTGDYVAWDPAAQGEVVQALGGFRAPYGVFGSLGNHESITGTEESITRLFTAQGIHILREERAPIRLGSDTLNLIGIDDSIPDDKAVKDLVMPGTVNILLNHNPNDFDQAVELGFDLMLAGHTHGGQLSLESLHRGLALIRLETPYVSGWFEKSGGQLYVNRGIGTTIFPIRIGARPEITVLELSRT
jgi:uncharacterized protein